jgi:hypothetical protein
MMDYAKAPKRALSPTNLGETDSPGFLRHRVDLRSKEALPRASVRERVFAADLVGLVMSSAGKGNLQPEPIPRRA